MNAGGEVGVQVDVADYAEGVADQLDVALRVLGAPLPSAFVMYRGDKCVVGAKLTVEQAVDLATRLTADTVDLGEVVPVVDDLVDLHGETSDGHCVTCWSYTASGLRAAVFPCPTRKLLAGLPGGAL